MEKKSSSNHLEKRKTGKFVRQEYYTKSFCIGENVKEKDIHIKYESVVANNQINQWHKNNPELRT